MRSTNWLLTDLARGTGKDNARAKPTSWAGVVPEPARHPMAAY